MFPTQNKVELFARQRGGFWSMDEYAGWDVWGNEVENSIIF
jgi:N6-adenosine-specific RNA methylase IME4